jgi:hypothetical protein
LVEQRIENPRVDGSIPSQATTVAKKCPETARFLGIFNWFSLVALSSGFGPSRDQERTSAFMIKSLVLQRLG